jgi:adenosine kinase
MTFQDRFRDHILPDQLHILNVSFLVPGMKRDYGGCAGNIAYNLRLLGEQTCLHCTDADESTSRDMVFIPFCHFVTQKGRRRTLRS